MSVEDVNVVELQALQGLADALLDMLAVCAEGRVEPRVDCRSDLCSNHYIFSRHLEILENLAELNFGLTFFIDLSSVDAVDTILEGTSNNVLVFLIAFWLGVDHVANGDDRDLEA